MDYETLNVVVASSFSACLHDPLLACFNNNYGAYGAALGRIARNVVLLLRDHAISGDPIEWIAKSALKTAMRSFLLADVRFTMNNPEHSDLINQIMQLASRITTTLVPPVQYEMRGLVRAYRNHLPLPIQDANKRDTETAIRECVKEISKKEIGRIATAAFKGATEFCLEHAFVTYDSEDEGQKLLASNLIAKHSAYYYRHVVVSECQNYLYGNQ